MHSKIFVPLMALFSGFALPLTSQAAPPELSLPIDCEIGKTCWLVNHVDREPGPGRSDYRCGPQSYNAHKGTDIAIKDDEAMRKGVGVLASASGRVVATRDGMADSTPADLISGTKFRGRECGNGLVIAHGDGWTTQYCHLKAGSISVSKGDKVSSGSRLGEVGRSGRSEFPHIHMTVRKGKTVYDPFGADTMIAACNVNGATNGLWTRDAAAKLSYPGPQPFHLGFSGQKPDIDNIRAGNENREMLARDAGALVFWMQAYTLAKNDKVTLSILAPDGSSFVSNTVVIDRPLARWYGFAGKNRRATSWPTGVYTGKVHINRDGLTPITASRQIVVK